MTVFRRPKFLPAKLLPAQLLNVAGAFATKGAAAAMQFVQSVVLSRFLGAEALGIYFFAISVFRIAEAAAPLGIPMATVREVAAAKAHDAWGTVRRIALRATLICFVLALAAGVIVWFLAEPVARTFDDHPLAAPAVRWMALAIVPGCTVVALTATLRGLGMQTSSNLLGSLVLPLVATASFALWLHEASYLGAVHAFILGQFAAIILLAAYVWHVTRGKHGTDAPTRSLFHQALPFWIISLASLGNDSLGVLLLGIFGTPADAGVFGIAVRLAMPLTFLGSSIQAVYEPRFAGLHRLGDTQGLRREYALSLRHSMALAGAMGITMAALATPLLSLFGAEFVSARPVFLIVLFGVCLVSAFGPAGSFLAMTSKANYNAWTAIASLPLAGGLMMVLIPHHGGMGAALATSAALAFRTVVQASAASREMRKIS